ncbi:MAG: N-acetylmuramoyl-L-alanine amidase [Lachnospiraceae bacterium]|nr:N-acetylmuramoyl-L-alanine amidase [Lachnospiraceae bacterium]
MRLFLKQKGSHLNKAGKIMAIMLSFVFMLSLSEISALAGNTITVNTSSSFSVNKVGYNSIFISWTPLEGAEGYEVLRAVTKNSQTGPTIPSQDDFKTIKKDITDTSYTDTELEPYQTYWYQVKAVVGTSSLTMGTGSARPEYDNTKNVKAVSNGDDVTITWDMVEGATQYAVTRSYIVNGTVIRDDYEKIVNSNIFTTDKDNSKIYMYRVTAYLEKEVGDSVSKFYGDTDCQKIYVMTAPENVTAESQNYNTNIVSFSEVEGANGYNIYRSTKSETGYKKIGFTEAGVYTFKDTKLSTGTTYYYKVEAYKTEKDTVSAGIMSKAASAKPTLTEPAEVTVVSRSYNSIKVSWSKVPGAKSYEVYRSTSKNSGYKKVATVTKKYYIDKNLKTNVKYYYKVKAVRGNNSSGYSKIMNTKAVPSATTSIVITSRDYNTLEVKWKKVAGADKYALYRSTKEKSGFKKIATVTSTTYIDSKVKGGIKYYYKVVPYKGKAAGKEKIESGIAVTKPVANVKVKNTSATSNKISWSKSAGAESYKIYRSTEKDGSYKSIGTTKKTVYTDKKAKTGVEYYYKVCGVVKGYEGEFSEPSKIVTKPLAVKNLKATGASSGKAKLTWDKSKDADSYQIYVSAEKSSGYRLAKTVKTNSCIVSLASNSTTYFRVYAVVNGVKSASKRVSFTAVSSIVLNKTEENIKADQTFQLTASVLPANATDTTITWKTSNKTVATVTSDGIVTGKKNGTCTITATASNGMTATCKVTVSNIIIVIDPGHGGMDPGTSFNGVYEKNVNLKIAHYVRAELETYKNVKVVMTRTGDTYPTLLERSQIAAINKADFFVSIHCNMLANKSTAANGTEVYVSLAPNYSVSTARMGNLVMNEMVKAGMNNRGVKTVRGENGADYYAVIRNTVAKGVPAILIEEGYLSGSSDHAVLTSDAGQRKLGIANATAIATYFELKKE